MPRLVAAALALAGAAAAAQPRPVVLVHGFLSSPLTWSAYTAPDGWLAAQGLKGYAVGDGQAEGRMDLGGLGRLTAPTKTLPQNALELARYIAGVKKATGAKQVDLVAHSMGGLVARYYIARVMATRDVAQLIMLGSPHGGSECSGLATALGVLAPASLELRPAFLRQIFNRRITERRGVPFRMLAGDPIADGFKAPCTGVPSDSMVSVNSVAAIEGEVQHMPVMHIGMTRSEEVFTRFVLPRLRDPHPAAGSSAASRPSSRSPPTQPAGDEDEAQFTQVFSGRVEGGSTAEIEVNLDEVAVASFALFDPSRSLEVTVRGASGRTIELSAQANGLIRVDDPASLLTLGYGFDKPRPGPWRVTLRAPRESTDYALSARVVGGAVLRSRAAPLAPRAGQVVTLSAVLERAREPLTGLTMRAVVRSPDGRTETLALRGEGTERTAIWRARLPGLHGIDIVATAQAGDLRVERTSLLAVDVRP
ncbi:MAG: alpha/beta fold hydrolase [Rubrivivax sp.]